MSGSETQKSQFEDTPQDWARRWQLELKAAREALADFYKVGEAADEALRDAQPTDSNTTKRLCLYPSSIQTVGAMLFGRMPEASASRRFADNNDDVARVGSTLLERVLNCHLARVDDSFSEATRNAMMDWRGTSGLGVVRHRYEMGEPVVVPGQPAKTDPVTGAVLAPEVPATERRPDERVETDYVFWGDVLWGLGNHTWPPPWIATAQLMSPEAIKKRFPDAGEVPLNAKHTAPDRREEDKVHPWDRAKVWEIWDAETRKVFWVVEGHNQTLDIQEDPLGLPGFFPIQRPLMANLTTSKLIPVSDYKFSQDLYESINVLMTRSSLLSKALRLAGLYPKEFGKDIEKLVEGGENKLYPVDNWAMFSEKGGVRGAIDFLPLEQIVAVLSTVRELLREQIDLVFQVTGQSDLMRGQQTMNGTPGEAQVKAKFGSIRLQAWQDELARFASDGQRIRAEIIAKHFSPETILRDANAEQLPEADKQFIGPAIELIKSGLSAYRIEIKPEAINLTDFAALKQERTEVMSALSGYFQAMVPLVQGFPDAMPHLINMGQWFISGLKGASTMEGIFDQMAEAAKQALAQQKQQQAQAAAQGQPPDPKMQIAQMKLQSDQLKAQADSAKVDKELAADMQRSQMAIAENEAKERSQAEWNVREAAQKQLVANALKPPEPLRQGPMVTHKPTLGGGPLR